MDGRVDCEDRLLERYKETGTSGVYLFDKLTRGLCVYRYVC